MRVADWIADYLYNAGVKRVHGLMGGGASGLNDGFIKHPGIEYICYHHEQGAGHAALGEAKYTGKLAVVNPTTGCAGTNCSTSVLNGYQDGLPILFLSGNVKLDNCSQWLNIERSIKIRHYGAQEANISHIMRPITKASYFVDKPILVAHALQNAIHLATTGRPGPVWVDIPANVQTAEMPEPGQYNYTHKEYQPFEAQILKDKINSTKRPLIVAGVGIRQANQITEFLNFVNVYKIPFVTTYGAQDYTPSDHPMNIGTPGVRGNRAGNFAMQNADFLLFLGTSLGAPVIGYDPQQFNPTAYKVYVDIEYDELNKDVIPMNWKIQTNIKNFFKEMS